ncbi:MAG: flagellar FliJ protein [Bacteriovoracaceae bacterium]|jgi:flagellar FliJ protein
MKGYKFKLDAVLKIRKLKEERCKMEIGQIQVQINKLNADIQRHKDGIKQSYDSHEEGLSNGLNGQELRFHPYFVSGKNADIQKIQAEINDLKVDVQEKFDELKYLRADVKVMDKMKEKDQTKYKKHLQKKQFEEIEEQVQNWNAQQKQGL